MNLLTPAETSLVDKHIETLRAFEIESITKSFKLVAIRAFLHDGALRTGIEIAANAATSREILLSDPRLVRDVTSKSIPDLGTVIPRKWATHWRQWPIEHLTKTDPRATKQKLFALDGDRILPIYVVAEEDGESFDAMVAEIVDYRLANYLLAKKHTRARRWMCRLASADGRPVIRLDRRQYPDLPSGKTSFVADGVEYHAEFLTAAVQIATCGGEGENALPSLLHLWFGSTAGQAGTAHSVELAEADDVLTLRPGRPVQTPAVDYVPIFDNYGLTGDPGSAPHSDKEIQVRQHPERW